MLNASKQFKPQLKPRSLTFLPLEPLLVFSEDYFVLLDAGLVACWPLAAALNLTKTFGIHVQIVILILQFINHWHLRFKIDRIWPIFKVNILLIFDRQNVPATNFSSTSTILYKTWIGTYFILMKRGCVIYWDCSVDWNMTHSRDLLSSVSCAIWVKF